MNNNSSLELFLFDMITRLDTLIEQAATIEKEPTSHLVVFNLGMAKGALQNALYYCRGEKK
jgi:hypothetical protein